jgi:hypothetical protein
MALKTAEADGSPKAVYWLVMRIYEFVVAVHGARFAPIEVLSLFSSERRNQNGEEPQPSSGLQNLARSPNRTW